MRVLACDPGAKPGFCWFSANRVPWVTYRPEDLDGLAFDEAVFEDQHLASFIYKNGRRTPVSKKSQLTLVRTAERLFLTVNADRKYRVLPDVWRRMLWPGATRLTKTVVLARLRVDYQGLVDHLPKTHQPDCLEAIGIAVAWSGQTPTQKEQYLVR